MLRRFSRTALLLTLFAAAAPVADISGAWDFNVETSQGSGDPSFVFKQDGEKLTGTYTGLLGSAELTGTVKGDHIEFSFESTVQDQKGKKVKFQVYARQGYTAPKSNVDN